MRKKHSYKTTVYKDESRLFYIALLTCFVVVGTYMYFVSASVAHVVMRKEVDSQIATLGTKVSQLESAYIEKQHAVSSDFASQKGFVLADKKIFIHKTSDTLVFNGR